MATPKAMLKLSVAFALCFALLPMAFGKFRFGDSPEDGYLSAGRYTNAFLGFTLPLPPDFQIDDSKLPKVPRDTTHQLLRLQRNRGVLQEGGAALMITVAQGDHVGDPSAGPPALSGPPAWVLLHGHYFLRTGTGYSTSLYGYTLGIDMLSVDPEVDKKLEDLVGQIRFFEPGRAKKVAGPDATPYNPIDPHRAELARGK